MVTDSHNIAAALPAVSSRIPGNIAVIKKASKGYRKYSFFELNTLSDAFASFLSNMGISKGDRVMLMVKPSIEFISVTFALFKIGAAVILIDPGMGYKNLLRCISRVEPNIFIGIPKAYLFKSIFRKTFKSVRTSISIGNSLGLFGKNIDSDTILDIVGNKIKPFHPVHANENDTAAILFTTGSTGPPKGVLYTHGIFQAQLKLIKEYYGITESDIDQPAFPLFALFSTALGACVVIPEMNAARPAEVNPKKFIRTITEHNVTYSFGSPAIWNVVSRYCLHKNIKLPTVKKILMAGAPVPGDLIQRIQNILLPDAEIHTPYGATESLPITSISGKEILTRTWKKTKKGEGACVGRPLPGLNILIIATKDEIITTWDENLIQPEGSIGEIVVKGPVVTAAYVNDKEKTKMAKITDKDGFWHRMGDIGYLDNNGCLWFCGRKDHRVISAKGTLYTIQCEAVINEHSEIFRTALVGVGPKNKQIPILIIEPFNKPDDPNKLLDEVKQLAHSHPLTESINHFLIHSGFPVDIRHNAKIFREKLAVWAEGQLKIKKTI